LDWFRTAIPTATTEQQQQGAFDSRSSGLLRHGGCCASREWAPPVWLDSEVCARQQGSSLPASDQQDPNCRRLSSTPQRTHYILRRWAEHCPRIQKNAVWLSALGGN
jgi:hypothetical protein